MASFAEACAGVLRMVYDADEPSIDDDDGEENSDDSEDEK